RRERRDDRALRGGRGGRVRGGPGRLRRRRPRRGRPGAARPSRAGHRPRRPGPPDPPRNLVGGVDPRGRRSAGAGLLPSRRRKDTGMAERLILIDEGEKGWATAAQEVFKEVMEADNRFAQQVGEKGGKLIAGNALQPISTATTIRSDVVTDGPFVETKEALGG